MGLPEITMPDGSPLSEDKTQPKVLGFKIEHKLTSRILPGTTRKEIYSKAAAVKKMNSVNSMFMVMQCTLDIWDYELVEVYDLDCPTDPVYITDPEDYLFD